MNTHEESLLPLVQKLSQEGVKINLTALFTFEQVSAAYEALKNGAPSNISIFAGRLADTGFYPIPLVKYGVELARKTTTIEVIWASTRETFNVIEADRLGCHIITAPMDMLKKLETLGTDPYQQSLTTVKTFVADSQASGLTLNLKK